MKFFPDDLKRCNDNPVYTYLLQLRLGYINSLNYEIPLNGSKVNLSDYVTKGDPTKIAFEIKKIDVAKYYRIDKKTLNKWVQAFCPQEFYSKWISQSKKVVNEADFKVLDDYLGFSLLIAHASKSFLAASFKIKQHAIKILMEDPNIQIMDFEVYKSIGKFPPKITEKLAIVIREELS